MIAEALRQVLTRLALHGISAEALALHKRTIKRALRLQGYSRREAREAICHEFTDRAAR